MRGRYTLTFTSELATPAARVWDVVGTMPGVNAELGPWLRMSAPGEAAGLRIEDAPTGEVLFSSWVLLGGWLPVDRHHLRLEEIHRGRGFVERSTSWSQHVWEHRRSVEPRGDAACTVTDHLAFEPRLAAAGPILVRVVGAVFRHRHRRLRARFGGAQLAAAAA
jgi:hypothetical protein